MPPAILSVFIRCVDDRMGRLAQILDEIEDFLPETRPQGSSGLKGNNPMLAVVTLLVLTALI
jgi:hypothetical protein